MKTHDSRNGKAGRRFAPVTLLGDVPIQNLCLAAAILSDALCLACRNQRRTRSANLATRLRASVRLSQCQRDALAALLTDKLQLGGVHWAAATHGTRNDLLCWIDVIAHKVVTPNDRTERQPPGASVADNRNV